MPFEYNGTLYVSYSLDPHVVLRLPQEELNAALVKSMAPKQQEEEMARRRRRGGRARLVVVEGIGGLCGAAYATRFEEAPNVRTTCPERYNSTSTNPPYVLCYDGVARHPSFSTRIRGREPPSFLGMMHTVLKRKGQSMYTVAAYTFSATPPFQITGISRPFGLGGLPTPYPINPCRARPIGARRAIIVRARTIPTGGSRGSKRKDLDQIARAL